MSDTYFIEKINCAYCEKENNFVNEEEPFCEMGLAWQFEFGANFVCEHCKRKNKIEQEFRAVKVRNNK